MYIFLALELINTKLLIGLLSKVGFNLGTSFVPALSALAIELCEEDLEGFSEYAK